MAKIRTLTLKGRSGEKYEFNVYPIDASFKAVGAVYAVTRRYKDSEGGYKHDILYVGETEDLSTRFQNHHKADCFKQHNANCICTHRDDDLDSHVTKEDDLIEQYKPDCND